MYEKTYNIKKLKAALQELQHQLKGYEIAQIAAIEKLHSNTVRVYLRGEINTPSIAKAILDRGRQIIKSREQADAA